MNLNFGLLYRIIIDQKVKKINKFDPKTNIKSEFFNLQFQLLKV